MLQLEKFSITDQNTSQTLVICANQMLIALFAEGL